LLHALAGEDGEDEPRLLAALAAMTVAFEGQTAPAATNAASAARSHDPNALP
jgi:hypothetical protein